MFHITSVRKSSLYFLGVLGALLLLLFSMALPARATPPQELNFAVETTYDVRQGPPSVSGVWTATGLINSSGDAWIDHINAGWNDAGFWLRNVHTTEVYTDDQGSITLEAHITNISGLNPFSGDGRWVIKSGTGAYANLHGVGTVSVYGEMTSFPNLIVTATYSGTGHFE
jgi:hypothetical protein